MKCSIYLNRRVFVMRCPNTKGKYGDFSEQSETVVSCYEKNNIILYECYAQTACRIFNESLVDNFASLVDCSTVNWELD